MKEKSASENFLSRWSRRKQQSETAPETVTENAPVTEQAEPAVAKDPAELPIWQREDVDPETKQQALRDLFRKPGFNKTTGLKNMKMTTTIMLLQAWAQWLPMR
ncbi:hypothetical protein A9E74_01686 [Methylophaga muralis]|uniref:DUF3306 domain-containing protein n=2 Tax=Methylophaga muralis TaxID=291169 RepID=A0A1E3GRF8_9GAMM|nr:hypothetical protein A9E74_01686 [Methylophaga muralis]